MLPWAQMRRCDQRKKNCRHTHTRTEVCSGGQKSTNETFVYRKLWLKKHVQTPAIWMHICICTYIRVLVACHKRNVGDAIELFLAGQLANWCMRTFGQSVNVAATARVVTTTKKKNNNNNDSATSNNKKWILVFSNNFCAWDFAAAIACLLFAWVQMIFASRFFCFFDFNIFFIDFHWAFFFFCFCFSHIYSFGLILFCNNMFNTRKWPLTVRLHNNVLCRLLFHAV